MLALVNTAADVVALRAIDAIVLFGGALVHKIAPLVLVSIVYHRVDGDVTSGTGAQVGVAARVPARASAGLSRAVQAPFVTFAIVLVRARATIPGVTSRAAAARSTAGAGGAVSARVFGKAGVLRHAHGFLGRGLRCRLRRRPRDRAARRQRREGDGDNLRRRQRCDRRFAAGQVAGGIPAHLWQHEVSSSTRSSPSKSADRLAGTIQLSVRRAANFQFPNAAIATHSVLAETGLRGMVVDRLNNVGHLLRAHLFEFAFLFLATIRAAIDDVIDFDANVLQPAAYALADPGCSVNGQHMHVSLVEAQRLRDAARRGTVELGPGLLLGLQNRGVVLGDG